jgi:hypothetical protein
LPSIGNCEFFLALTKSDAERLFGARDCCVTVVQSYEEMLASEHAQHRKFVLRPPGSPVPVLGLSTARRCPNAGRRRRTVSTITRFPSPDLKGTPLRPAPSDGVVAAVVKDGRAAERAREIAYELAPDRC